MAGATVLLIISWQVRNEAEVDEARPADAIVVLGAAEYAGRPSPVFRLRLDHAYQLFRRKLAPIIITTGGAGGDPHYSEGQVGRDYLTERGISDVNLIAETQGYNTDESTRRVSVIMRTNGMRSCILVSDAYHMYRAKRMMESLGFDVYVSPRPDSIPRTGWSRFLSSLREAFSYLLYRSHVT